MPKEILTSITSKQWVEREKENLFNSFKGGVCCHRVQNSWRNNAFTSRIQWLWGLRRKKQSIRLGVSAVQIQAINGFHWIIVIVKMLITFFNGLIQNDFLNWYDLIIDGMFDSIWCTILPLKLAKNAKSPILVYLFGEKKTSYQLLVSINQSKLKCKNLCSWWLLVHAIKSAFWVPSTQMLVKIYNSCYIGKSGKNPTWTFWFFYVTVCSRVFTH